MDKQHYARICLKFGEGALYRGINGPIVFECDLLYATEALKPQESLLTGRDERAAALREVLYKALHCFEAGRSSNFVVKSEPFACGALDPSRVAPLSFTASASLGPRHSVLQAQAIADVIDKSDEYERFMQMHQTLPPSSVVEALDLSRIV